MKIEEMIKELIKQAQEAEAKGNYEEASRIHDYQFKLIDDYYKSMKK